MNSMKTPLLLAHRGDTQNYPENTLDAFASALKKGADGFEFDVNLNSKDEAIIVHNLIFDENLNYPSLTKVLDQFAGKCRLEMEIKAMQNGAVEKIAKIVDQYRPLDLEVTTSTQVLCHQIAQYFPNNKRGLIFRKWLIEDWMSDKFKIEWVLNHLKLAQFNVLHLDLDLYFPELVRVLHDNGVTLHTHLKTDSKEDLQRVLDLEIDQCTIDDIGVLKLENDL